MNIMLFCLAKKGSGAGIIESICIDCLDTNIQLYCIVSNQMQGLERIEGRGSNIHIIKIDSGNTKTFAYNTIKMRMKGLRKIRREIENIGFDLYLEVFGHPWGHWINKIVKTRNSATICHDPLPHKGEMLINRFFSYYEYKKSSNLVVMTKSLADIAHKRFDKKVYYMKHGLFSCYDKTGGEVRASSTINFIFFGRIEPYKGIKYLLEAFNMFRDDEPVTLTIAGQGDMNEYRDYILRNKKIHVENEFISDERIDSLFSQDKTILVVPYTEATQSGVIPVAIDHLVPVIATDTGGLKEQLNEGKIGLFCKPSDAVSLYSAMKSIVDEPEIINKEKEKMRDYRETLRWDTILFKLINDMDSDKHIVNGR